MLHQDQNDLAEILCDPESMSHYPKPFTLEQVSGWIDWNISSYKEYSHGLWAVILKEGDLFLGDCGITLQEIDGETLPELGYHIKKEYRGKGYAAEAAYGCMQYAFDRLGIDKLYTYTSIENAPSIRVAEKNGMEYQKHFHKAIMGEVVEEVLYCISRQRFYRTG